MEAGDVVEIIVYIVFVPLLPILVALKWLWHKYGNGKFVKFTLWENGIPLVCSIGYAFLVCWWPYHIEEWASVQDAVDFLTRVLQFLLPLQITAAIARNKLGIASYRKFTSKMLQIKKFTNDEIITYMAKAMKWRFRDKARAEKLFDKEALQNLYNGKKLPDAMIDDLYAKIITVPGDTSKRNAALALMKEAQGAYGEIKSSAQYKIPNLFTSFFYFTMAVYFFILPYTFVEDTPGDRVFKCVVYLYVFMGMFNISLFISDPFMSGTKGMQTVTKIEQAFNKKVEYKKGGVSKEQTSKQELVYTPFKLKI